MPNVTSVWDFSPGETLTAAKLDDVNCGIHVFSGTATRDAAYGGSGERTLAEGEFAYLADSNTTQYYDGSSWLSLGGKIGQIVSTAKTDTFSTTSTTFVDITGLSASITPSATSSKILAIVSFSASVSADIAIMFRLMRDSTAINIGDAAGSRTRASASMIFNDSVMQQGTYNWQFLDSPATTAATTYKVQMFVNTGTGYINRTGLDNDAATRPRTAANITVMEISA